MPMTPVMPMYYVDCPDCNGAGAQSCVVCHGTGHGLVGDPTEVPCSYCDGGLQRLACPSCRGRGRLCAEWLVEWARRPGNQTAQAVEYLCEMLEATVAAWKGDRR